MALYDIMTSVHPHYKPVEEPTEYFEAYQPSDEKPGPTKTVRRPKETRSWQILTA